MSKYSFEDLCLIMKLNPKLYDNIICYLYNRVVEEDVQNAERELGVKFPSDLRKILLTWGRIAGIDEESYLSIVPAKARLKGLSKWKVSALEHNNIVESTLELRKESDLPNKYIVVYYAEDWYGCIDTSAPEGAVIEWDYFNKFVEWEVNNSFIDSIFENYICSYDLLEDLLEGSFKWPNSLKEKLVPDFERWQKEFKNKRLMPREWF
ncbi:MAG: SMI1/KNR4 family protein [Thermoguttaceae bacterium]|nr:SMI1/KNR4 family protein [Thermoguttaceae bacterium]